MKRVIIEKIRWPNDRFLCFPIKIGPLNKFLICMANKKEVQHMLTPLYQTIGYLSRRTRYTKYMAYLKRRTIDALKIIRYGSIRSSHLHRR